MTPDETFPSSGTQAVRLPIDGCFPEGVRKVEVRVSGQESIIAPVGKTWDGFFLGGPSVSDDFLSEQLVQSQAI